MTHPLADSNIADRRLRVVASERTDGDLHPGRISPPTLRARQRAATPSTRHWFMTDQVHGVDVIEVDGRESWAPTHGVADVIVTRELDLPIAIWAADCAPLVLAADDGTLVGAHAGWRGLVAGVVDVAVATATRDGATIAAAVLGPVVHPCCYEFDSEDLAKVPDAIEAHTTAGRPALDVPATVAASLARHGVSITATGPCTGCDDRWFSHRVRAEPGRHAVIAWWESVA